MATDTLHRPAFISSVIYKDNRAALKWLQNAFGFEASEVLTAANGDIVHAEMSHGDGPRIDRWEEYTARSRTSRGRHRCALRASAASGS